MFWRMRYAAMDDGAATIGADGGVSGGAPVGSNGVAAGNGDVGAAGGTAPVQPGSVLASGAGTPGTSEQPQEFIPEKYRVKTAEGALDIEASARKLAEAHGNLTKRMVDGGAPPATAEEYTFEVPEALKDAMGDLSKDEMYGQFRTGMHGLGLTQKQFEGVMGFYTQLAPQLAAGGSQLTQEGTLAALKATWADDATYQKNMGAAWSAAQSVARASGIPIATLESSLGNNPEFIKIMAALAPEFKEDQPVDGGQASLVSNEDEIKALMMSEANTNGKHPQHAQVRAKIDAYYARKYGNTPVTR